MFFGIKEYNNVVIAIDVNYRRVVALTYKLYTFVFRSDNTISITLNMTGFDRTAFTLQFIEAYKNKRILWDSKHPFHSFKLYRRVAWQELSAETSLTVGKCKIKVNYLRKTYYGITRNNAEKNYLSDGGNDNIVII